MDSAYFENLKEPQAAADGPDKSQHSESLLKSIEDGEGFYEALNMPLQTKTVDEGSYQTYNKESEPDKDKRSCSPLRELVASDNKGDKPLLSNHKRALNPKVIDMRSRSGGNRATQSNNLGCSGTAMTINSHILMSLSRSATSRSDLDIDVNQKFKNE